ncbi:uncharacterized protein LOC129870631 isoform X2 [Solanum dulcamara]|uniref:uncharacterized protein LOC129870631 isoform X2 n=1 Tax=Solanum dulcamara TaxID=45834 RepID=UPI00248545D9|nr:uncharacterized protein LOC129870631 isoform X2 [Solanum dulcamara]
MATPFGPLHGFISPSKFSPHEAFPLNKQTHLPLLMKRNKQLSKSINAVVATDIITSDPTQVDITWQIVVGSLAGLTPFVVAGVEFSKRIVKQRKCEVCRGSGLVLKNKFFKRCPSCGGFLPWQSWRRFFTG